MTGRTRENIMGKLDGVPFEKKGSAKLYDSVPALSRIFLGQSDTDGTALTEAESRRLLNLRRIAEIDLDMEIKRKERIPLDVLESVNDRAFSNVAGMLKSNRDKPLTEEAINDMLTELRSVSEAIRHG